MPRSLVIALLALCSGVLLLPRGAHRVLAAPAQDAPLITVGGDVRTPFALTADDFAWLPTDAQTRSCGQNRPEAYGGLSLQGVVEAAGPLAADPADYTVTVAGASGQSATYPGDALEPFPSPDSNEPGGPLLADIEAPDALPAEDGPVLLLSQSCDPARDVMDVQTITVNVTPGAATSALAASVDTWTGLAAAALQPDDLPGFTRLYVDHIVINPLPQQATVQVLSYWKQGDTHLVETLYTYTDAAQPTQQMDALDVKDAVDDAGCDEDSVQNLGAQGFGDEDVAYSYTCPPASDGGAPLAVAADSTRIGRVVATTVVAVPQPGDPTATLLAAAQAAAARLATASQ